VYPLSCPGKGWLTDIATGLAIMIGTVWLRLDATQESIIPFINAIF
jgi:hypothetical protein